MPRLQSRSFGKHDQKPLANISTFVLLISSSDTSLKLQLLSQALLNSFKLNFLLACVISEQKCTQVQYLQISPQIRKLVFMFSLNSHTYNIDIRLAVRIRQISMFNKLFYSQKNQLHTYLNQFSPP